MTDKTPEALRLAGKLYDDGDVPSLEECSQAASLLRRQHQRIEELEKALWALIEASPNTGESQWCGWQEISPWDNARALLSTMKPSMNWQPIETAPKDGTSVLLTNGSDVAHGNWFHAEGYIREKRDLDGRYIDQDEFEGFDGWIDFMGGMQPEPTHWMPLPAPPKTED